MSDYVNWFVNDGQKNFETFLPELINRGTIRCLQIGAYTGDASVWLYNNILKSSDSVLVDVDTWEGSEEPVHYEMNWHTVESLYNAKTSAGRADKKIIKYKGTSDSFFQNNREMYDFIYIDGDHTAYGVLKDAVAAYECLNVGGIIAFDDYQWSAGLGLIKEPKLAIDAFGNVYQDRLQLLLQDYQCWYRKIQ
jgi:predicted O-methyltransferase YrrM